MTTEAQKTAARKYDSENTIMLSVKLNKKTDADLVRHVNKFANKQAYIKALIREDIISGHWKGNQ